MTTTPTIWRAPLHSQCGDRGCSVNPYTIGLSNGNNLVVWTDDTSGTSAGNDVFGQIFGPEGNPVGAAFQVNSSFFADGEFLGSIAPQTDGGFVIAYVDDEARGTADDAIRVERYDAAGNPSLTTSITGAAGAVSDPEITVAPDGSYMISFTRKSPAISTSVRWWSAPLTRSAPSSTPPRTARIRYHSDNAGLSNNNFVTVYEEVDAGTTSIEVKVVTSAGANVIFQQPATLR